MQRAERTGHLAQEPERLAPWQRLTHPLPEVTAREVLHREKDVIVGNPDVVDARDVGVVEMRYQMILAQEAVEGVAALDDVGDLPEDLEHTLLAGFWKLGEVDARRTADGDALQTAVTTHTHGAEAVREIGRAHV